ncbi:MAG: DNA methyltransferase [Candidatus Saccharimonadales bacterium]
MPRLSWNEIQDRATEFASKYAGETYEKGESQSFWSDFLNVYGIDRKRHGAYFEYAVKKVSGAQGFVDMFWPGKLLAEQKSAGRDLSKASVQAFEYLDTMPDHDLPIGIVVSDFANFEYRDLGTNETTVFKLQDFPKHVRLFAFLIEEQSRKLAEENPVNRKAAEAMAELHNTLCETGYTGHDLELLLVRLVFCMFADDSGIFEHRSFEHYLYNRTEIDGSDFGPRLINVFKVLNQDILDRSSTLDEDLKVFPYINGGLFAEKLDIPDFNHNMRDALLKAMELDWSQVSPAIFGSMFQGVMDEKQRRNLGAHYTSEVNILKVIKPLFLDDLYAEFAQVRHQKKKLSEFHDKLASLRFLDPACGCGNFLVITYRELRKLEHKVLEALYGKTMGMFDVGEHGVVKCDVDQMYGIEIEEFPSLIAETALWLTDHQMNNEFSKESGKTFKRIPLVKHANIHHENALEIDWEDVIPHGKLNYILGNPPFIGSKLMTEDQREQATKFIVPRDAHSNILPTSSLKVLDYVAGWYMAAALYMQNTSIRAAFVSTNSITQGEQVSILWRKLLKYGLEIDFAHRTFRWSNDAKGNAAVYCVIIGFSWQNHAKVKRIFDYPDLIGDPIELSAKNINAYLIDAPNIFIDSRTKPICDAPLIGIGNKPIDGGNYLFTKEEKLEFLSKEPDASKYFHRWIGSDEFINNKERWCLWLGDANPAELRSLPHVIARIDAVRQYRFNSPSKPTQELANRPTRFHVENMPSNSYIVIPEVSSERRAYIPIGYMRPDSLASNLVKIIPNATLYHFGILTSQMHMAWMRAVAGRLESRYRYSKDIVYNNFIWPEQVSDAQKAEIEKLAQAILDARANYPDATLADLYDPLTMPPDLAKAHKALDKAVDKLYQKEPFANDAERVALLFNLYQHKNNA